MVKRFIIYICIALLSGCSTAAQREQAEALRKLGEAYMAQGNYNAAMGEFFKAERLYAEDAYLYNDLGLSYLAKKKLELAVTHFKKALELKPSYSAALNNLGAAYLAQKKWDEAIFYLEKVLDNLIFSETYLSLANIGWAYYNKKEYEKAESLYLKAIDLAPNYAVAQRGLARAYMAMDKISQAIDTLESCIKNAPRFAQAYFDLATAYRLSRNYDKALQNYKKVVALIPTSQLALQAKQNIEELQPTDRFFKP